ncbi:MAG TPA: hypothetical protein VGD45_09180 [Steroidobacter sp.]|uniref:hypothetical protein n=1 Tax=Steroidobacter sp. TaxID=1978227 RepID=UPI002EDAD0C5
MDNDFFTWDDFVKNFGREMRIAGEVYDGMVKNGLQDGSLLQFDFVFISDKKAKLERLRARFGHGPEQGHGLLQSRQFEAAAIGPDGRV